ncbi:hypothetical protein J6590_050063 [Homalodisca vitripennis]|nr:hypothetical protein J6590_050063 [Homalodisca vitripennis]
MRTPACLTRCHYDTLRNPTTILALTVVKSRSVRTAVHNFSNSLSSKRGCRRSHFVFCRATPASRQSGIYYGNFSFRQVMTQRSTWTHILRPKAATVVLVDRCALSVQPGRRSLTFQRTASVNESRSSQVTVTSMKEPDSRN